MPLATIEQAVEDIRDGKMIIIVDDEDRENEGRPGVACGKGHAGNDQLYGCSRPRSYMHAAN